LAPRGCGWEDEAVGRLEDVDLSLKLSREEQDRLLELHGQRLAQLRLALGGLIGSGELGPPLCVLFEGWDASGKGGAIKRLVAPLDARHVRVKQFAAPTPDEKRHHYEEALEEMLERTDTDRAPWRIVPAESKRHARVHVMRQVIAAIEEGSAHHGFALPEPLEAVAG